MKLGYLPYIALGFFVTLTIGVIGGSIATSYVDIDLEESRRTYYAVAEGANLVRIENGKETRYGSDKGAIEARSDIQALSVYMTK